MLSVTIFFNKSKWQYCGSGTISTVLIYCALFICAIVIYGQSEIVNLEQRPSQYASGSLRQEHSTLLFANNLPVVGGYISSVNMQLHFD